MISIVIPFNNEKYLERCIKSIKEQSFKNYEVILIIDNQKIDEKSIKLKYPDVRCFRTQEETLGVGNARNLGIEKANGEYIMFVDVDDTIDKNLLNNLETYIKQGIEMIKYKIKIVESSGETIKPRQISFETITGEEGFKKLCFHDNYLDSPCLYLIKKELLKKTNLKFEKNMYHEDFGLIPELIINAKTIIATNFYGYNYYQTPDSIMRNMEYSKQIKKIEDKIQHFLRVKKNIKNYKLSVITKSKFLWYYINSILLAIKDLKEEDKRKYIKSLKKMKFTDGLIPMNTRQIVKKLLLKINVEMYLKCLK